MLLTLYVRYGVFKYSVDVCFVSVADGQMVYDDEDTAFYCSWWIFYTEFDLARRG